LKRLDPEERRTLAKRASLETVASPSGWGRTNCPFCLDRTGKADHRQSFGFNHATGFYHCFKCSVAGRIDGYDDVHSEFDPKWKSNEAEAVCRQAPESYTAIGVEPGLTAQSLTEARAYLRSRGLGRNVCREAQVGVCDSGKYSGRVIVPITSPEGEWLGWVGRIWESIPKDILDTIFALGGSAPGRKYTYPAGMRRAEILFNSAALLVETDEPVIAVEGVFDALAYWPHAAAVLGTASEQQIWALGAARRPVAVVLDGDAWRQGEALAMRLQLEGQRAGFVRLPPKVDPDEVDQGWLREEARRCLP
jgi:hypothetical protein